MSSSGSRIGDRVVQWANFLGIGIFSVVSCGIFGFLDGVENDEKKSGIGYMDEIFHIPQAQKYCSGRFDEWDSKITTLPGLYLFSIGILNPVSRCIGADVSSICDVTTLRSISLALSFLNYFLLQKLIFQIHGGKHYFNEGKASLSAFNLAIFPILYFFGFFYYTDVGSTFMVLLMYCLHLDDRHLFASFIGLLSIIFRQTNVIWVAFIGIQSLGPYLHHVVHTQMQRDKFSLTIGGQAAEYIQGVFFLLKTPEALYYFLMAILPVISGYLLVGLCFITFVVINGGIVVGDRSAHAATFHPTQILYFGGFTFVFSFSYCITKIGPLVHFMKKRYIVTTIVILTAYGVVLNFTYAHPYLLADNRHYTFYIWRKIIDRNEFSRFLIMPFCLFGLFSVFYSLRKSNVMFILTFPIFVFINLAPQLLLEFRYFILPYLIYRLQVRPQSWWKLSAETALYFVINGITIYLYVYKPFRWPHEPEQLQRFMW